jgi:hypothetical protein
LSDNPVYEALSYVWGEESSQYFVWLAGYRHRVTENLHRALYQLRPSSGHRTLWIDALCINQKDNEERNEQVQKMRNIYSQATKVVVWLGASYENSIDAFALLEDIRKNIGDKERVRTILEDSTRIQQIRGVMSLFQRDYFFSCVDCAGS